jgi:hypothetical protein
MGVVELDLRNVDVRRLRTGTVDRTEWESVVRGEKAKEEKEEEEEEVLQ